MKMSTRQKFYNVRTAIIFSVAAITDAVDGKLARKYNQITTFGKFLDPVADKMLTTAAFLGMAGICRKIFCQSCKPLCQLL